MSASENRIDLKDKKTTNCKNKKTFYLLPDVYHSY